MAVLCDELNLLFLCVPKTACSAIAKVLIEQLNGKWIPPKEVFSKCGTKFLGVKHCTLEDLIEFGYLTPERAQTLLKVASTRNPFDWVISSYMYARSIYRIEGEETQTAWVLRTIDYFRYAATHTFDEFVAKFYAGEARSVSARWAQSVNFIFRYEQLQEDFNSVLSYLGVSRPINIPLFNVTPGKDTDYRTYYSEYSKAAVTEAFSYDLNCFGYSFNEVDQNKLIYKNPYLRFKGTTQDCEQAKYQIFDQTVVPIFQRCTFQFDQNIFSAILALNKE